MINSNKIFYSKIICYKKSLEATNKDGGNPPYFNWEEIMKIFLKAACVAAVAVVPSIATAACDSGEIVIKFSHVTNTDKHPKGIAATLLEQRINDEMNGKACMEVFPNSTLYNLSLIHI